MADNGASLRAVSQALDRRGIRLSATGVRRLLRNPTYVTGQWSVTYGGTTYPCRPLHLSHAVDRALFFRVNARRP